MKRYVEEPGNDTVVAAMAQARSWITCRICFVEGMRALGLSAGGRALASFEDDWPRLEIIELDQALAELAAVVASEDGLRSLDAIHLAAALSLPAPDLVLATWDRRLHAAAVGRGLAALPESI